MAPPVKTAGFGLPAAEFLLLLDALYSVAKGVAEACHDLTLEEVASGDKSLADLNDAAVKNAVVQATTSAVNLTIALGVVQGQLTDFKTKIDAVQILARGFPARIK